jgi:ClpP class serine protease
MAAATEQNNQSAAQTDKKPGVTAGHGWMYQTANGVRSLFWFVLTILFISEALQPYWTCAARTEVLQQFQQERKSRVIGLIHHQDQVSLFGVPVSSSISIEDSEAVLRAIRLTPPEQPIDVILHTPGGLVLAAEQIAKALAEHKGKVTVFVPHYAMSGGTLIALAADEIVMNPNAVLGPVDPQIGPVPAASVVKVLESKMERSPSTTAATRSSATRWPAVERSPRSATPLGTPT